MKYLFTNTFHNREAKISVKAEYSSQSLEGFMTMLSAEAYHGDGYAKRKIAEIESLTCGAKDCRCGSFLKVIK